MENIRVNKALNDSIEWIRKNPYTEEVVSISDVELLDSKERFTVSEIQGDYPVDVIFTAMQKIEVTYKNKYYGLRKDIIVAGFDAVRYKDFQLTDATTGNKFKMKSSCIEEAKVDAENFLKEYWKRVQKGINKIMDKIF